MTFGAIRLRFRAAASSAAATALLIALTLTAFSPACDADFFNIDDNFVYDNINVQNGLTKDSVLWALSSTEYWNWHPLTWLSYQLDTELFGDSAAVYHRTNVALHAANVALLFWALLKMTGARWRSLAVAALFGVHPLRVESVAWIAERKDVLSGLFWMLTLLAYAHYASRPSWGRLALAVTAFFLGLTAKQMLVTLPCVLCLLDFWPLGRIPSRRSPQTDIGADAPRFPTASMRRLAWEKAPFFILAALACDMTMAAQEDAIKQNLSLERRLGNATMSYVRYLGMTLRPSGLLPWYPYPALIEPWKIVLAGLLLAGITALTIWQLQRPYLLVGWLWFLGTLVPVIGLVQVGEQALADRYTYVPSIGLLIALIWGGAALAETRQRRFALTVMVVLAVGASVACTLRQVRLWRNGEVMWQHCIAANDQVAFYHFYLALNYEEKQEWEKAKREYLIAQALDPKSKVIRGQMLCFRERLLKMKAGSNVQPPRTPDEAPGP
jgi:protein O-mannosyl-transferase